MKATAFFEIKCKLSHYWNLQGYLFNMISCRTWKKRSEVLVNIQSCQWNIRKDVKFSWGFHFCVVEYVYPFLTTVTKVRVSLRCHEPGGVILLGIHSPLSLSVSISEAVGAMMMFLPSHKFICSIVTDEYESKAITGSCITTSPANHNNRGRSEIYWLVQCPRCCYVLQSNLLIPFKKQLFYVSTKNIERGLFDFGFRLYLKSSCYLKRK